MPDHPRMPGSLRRRTAMAGFATTALSALVRAAALEPGLLRIGGTGMALAAMRQIGDAFTATRHQVTIKVLPSLGTGGGLAAVTAAAIDLALSARQTNDAEYAKGLRSLAYARTPIAFVTHPTTGIHGITLAEVARILVGTTRAWPDGTPIRLVRREPSDADWAMLRALCPEMAEAVTNAQARSGLLTVATDQENADALERLPGSFGMMSIGQIRAEARGVVPLSLDGEAPDPNALTAGRYKLSRTLYAVWRDPPTPDIAKFTGFLRTEQTRELLVGLGHIPLAGTGA